MESLFSWVCPAGSVRIGVVWMGLSGKVKVFPAGSVWLGESLFGWV